MFKESHDAAEVLITMMQEYVAFANRCEQIGALAQRGGDGRDERRVAQFRRMVPFVNGHQAGGVERTVNNVQILFTEAEGPQERLPNLGWAIRIQFQPDGVAPAPFVEFVFHGLEKIGDFLLIDIKFAVARNPEMPVTEDFGAGKQIGQEVAD